MAAHRARVAIIGGGVVGCAIASHFARHGARCVLLEANACLVAGASCGNSGIVCTGYDAAPGSLERRCIRRGAAPLRHMLASAQVPHAPVGSLVVAWTDEELAALPGIVAANHEAGDTDVVQLSQRQLRAAEPHLSPDALGAVHIQGETLVDPWLMAHVLAEDAARRGVEVLTHTRVTQARLRDGVWRLAAPNGWQTEADVVINAAGLHGDTVQQLLRAGSDGSAGAGAEADAVGAGGGETPFTITPRRGDFLVYDGLAKSCDGRDGRDGRDGAGSRLLRSPIQPVPSGFTKGVFVFSTVYGHVLVGPTAEDVTDRQVPCTPGIRPRQRDALARHAARVLPALAGVAPVGEYSGLRPATEHRDYCITADEASRVVTVGGIRSTGVTASLGIADLAWELFEATFCGGGGTALNTSAGGAPRGTPSTEPAGSRAWPVLLPLQTLAQQLDGTGALGRAGVTPGAGVAVSGPLFLRASRDAGSGADCVADHHDGSSCAARDTGTKVYAVTHPITQYGLARARA